MTNSDLHYRYFISYSGVKLPLNLVNEISLEQLHNRNTFYRAAYNEHGRMIVCQKVIYSEVDTQHEYEYDADGKLIFARVTEGDEVRELKFGA